MTADKIYNIANIETAQFVVQSSEYQELLKRIEEKQELLSYIPDNEKEKRLKISQELNRLKEQLEQFKQEVLRLAETFTKIDINTERLQLAKEHFDKGEFREADTILKSENLNQELEDTILEEKRGQKIIEQAQEKRRQLSNEFLIKARITALLFDKPNRFKNACIYFERSLKAERTPENLFEYALFLQNHRQFDTARTFYEEAYTIYERLAKVNPESYEPDVAMTLNNLGNLYADKNDYVPAEQAYKKALEIKERLAKVNPESYEPYVATTLNNLGNLYADKNDYVSAEQAYKKALEIRERLAKKIPQRFELELSRTLVLLGMLERKTNDIENCKINLLRAREIAERYSVIPFAQQILNLVSQTLNDMVLST